jgi:hypothetical protein
MWRIDSSFPNITLPSCHHGRVGQKHSSDWLLASNLPALWRAWLSPAEGTTWDTSSLLLCGHFRRASWDTVNGGKVISKRAARDGSVTMGGHVVRRGDDVDDFTSTTIFGRVVAFCATQHVAGLIRRQLKPHRHIQNECCGMLPVVSFSPCRFRTPHPVSAASPLSCTGRKQYLRPPSHGPSWKITCKQNRIGDHACLEFCEETGN